MRLDALEIALDVVLVALRHALLVHDLFDDLLVVRIDSLVRGRGEALLRRGDDRLAGGWALAVDARQLLVLELGLEVGGGVALHVGVVLVAPLVAVLLPALAALLAVLLALA